MKQNSCNFTFIPEVDFDKFLDRTRTSFSERLKIRRAIMTVDLDKPQYNRSRKSQALLIGFLTDYSLLQQYKTFRRP